MNIVPFGELSYNTGWKKQITIVFFEKEYEITLKIKSYSLQDPILEKQKIAYEYFLGKQSFLMHQAEQKIISEYGGNDLRFIPTMILLNRKGDIALLCDDVLDQDNGIAIVFCENIKIYSQDDYL